MFLREYEFWLVSTLTEKTKEKKKEKDSGSKCLHTIKITNMSLHSLEGYKGNDSYVIVVPKDITSYLPRGIPFFPRTPSRGGTYALAIPLTGIGGMHFTIGVTSLFR